MKRLLVLVVALMPLTGVAQDLPPGQYSFAATLTDTQWPTCPQTICPKLITGSGSVSNVRSRTQRRLYYSSRNTVLTQYGGNRWTGTTFKGKIYVPDTGEYCTGAQYINFVPRTKAFQVALVGICHTIPNFRVNWTGTYRKLP